jgi:hypothetical protein
MSGTSQPRDRLILFAGFAIGLLLRGLTFRYRGVFDMIDYIRWGRGSLEVGMARTYLGMHFPLQYHLYEVFFWLSQQLAMDPFVVFKAANLPFDVATFVLLVALLAHSGANVLYALVYWLHPWFVVVFGLGYIDFQLTFCLVLSIWLLHRGDSTLDYFIAGIPFAAAVLMKPQATLPCVALAMYAAMRWRETGKPDVAYMLVPVLLLAGVYEVYFTVALWPSLGMRALAVLPASYARVGSFMPVLTAHMLNVWYPIAYMLKSPDAEIWTVSSKSFLLPHVQVRFAALILVTAVIAWYAFVLARSPRPLSASDRVRYLLTFATFVVPAIATSAHENHLFAASVLFVPLLGSAIARPARWAIHALLAIQAVNLEGIYGVDFFARWLRPIYSFEARLTLSLISIVCFFFVARALYAAIQPEPLLQP